LTLLEEAEVFTCAFDNLLVLRRKRLIKLLHHVRVLLRRLIIHRELRMFVAAHPSRIAATCHLRLGRRVLSGSRIRA
jgi:hypothetical protein